MQLDTAQRDAWLGDRTLREDSTAERQNCLGKDRTSGEGIAHSGQWSQREDHGMLT